MRKLMLGGLGGALLAAIVACSSEAKLGEGCDEEGAESGECESGGVCGRASDGAALTCLKVCKEQADCASTQECNGVSGTATKGCRTKK